MIESLANSCPQHVKNEVNASFSKNVVHHDFTDNCNKLAEQAASRVKHVKEKIKNGH